jgi:DNA-binding NtrC family response regulator
MSQPIMTLRQKMLAFEKQLICEALERCHTRAELAADLGLPKTTLFRRLRRHGLLTAP